MKKKLSPSLYIVLSSILVSACNLTKRVPDGSYLLTENKIEVNDKKSSDSKVTAQLYQQPNSSIGGLPLRLMVYNAANAQPRADYDQWLERNPNTKQFLVSLLSEKQVDRLGDSFFVSGISNTMKDFGEAPVIFDSERADRSEIRLKNYFFNQGYFNTTVSKEIDTVSKEKKALVTYKIQTGSPFLLDSISTKINSPELEALYEEKNKITFLHKDDKYNAAVLDRERDRMTTFFRNNGVFDFQKSYINFEIDTLKQKNTADILVRVEDKSIKMSNSDTLIKEPFKIYKIDEVNIYTTNFQNRKDELKKTTYRGVNIFSKGKLNYKAKTLYDANFINHGDVYSDQKRALTIKSFSSYLNVFNYPTIEFLANKNDTVQNSLIANIYVSPRKRASFNPSVDVTHSNIQQIGIEGAVSTSFRNIFKGSETLDVSFRGNIGSSTSPNFRTTDRFFNIIEYGVDVKLGIPKFWFFTDTDVLISRQMFPTTNVSVGLSNQQNIGLDKQNFTSIFNYNWSPRNRNNLSLDVFNIQFVKNTNPGNYFNVYRTSYNTLNNIATNTKNVPDEYFDELGNLIINDGVDAFIEDVLQNNSLIPIRDPKYRQVASIAERRKRLTENNLILATNLTFTTSTRTGIQDNDFYNLKAKVETAGNLFSLMNLNQRADGRRTFLDVAYSQYVKTELEYVKYFDLGNKNVIAIRAFGGIAIPYGNSTNIPFSRSYFAGGSNDNRAWQSYRLGPGSSGGVNDFNEANMKMAFNLEYRFNVSGPINLALFADAGNIWNTLDDTSNEDMKFTGWNSLKDIALGTGLGLRYDLSFFVIRFDTGFKTYNPDKELENKWFHQWNFKEMQINVGVNYPF